ncbi:MAG: transcriptional repressor [Nitrospirota bacterium]|nr:transcriptional repressor [Nitrospirota bacterium]
MAQKDDRTIKSALREKGYRLTGPRKGVADLLAKEGRPLSVQEIYEKMQKKVDLATVYRVIHLLLDLGLARKTGSPSGSALYEMEGEQHHHHIFCKECGRMEEIEGCLLSALEKELSRKKRFTITGHTLEFFGVCYDCGQKG